MTTGTRHVQVHYYSRATEQERLARFFGRLLFGTDFDRIYHAMDVVAEMPDGSAILDVPCGGGITVGRLRSGQRVRYVAMDISARTGRARKTVPDQACFYD